MKTKEFKKKKIPDFKFDKFKVILIGVSKYPEDKRIENIPNINANIGILKNVFSDKKLIGVSDNNLTVSVNQNKVNFEKSLTNFVKNTEIDDTVIIYYSGHGFINPNDLDLYFGTTDTNLDDIASTSVSAARFKEIIDLSVAKNKIVIIDACNSGDFINHINNDEIFGDIFVITSSPDDEPSLYPVNAKNSPTYFTGILADTVKNGIENGKSYITINNVFNEIFTVSKNKSLPLPQKSATFAANRIKFAKNIKFVDDENDLNNNIVNQFVTIISTVFDFVNFSKI